MDCKLTTKKQAEINDRKIRMYVIASEALSIYIVEWETEGKEISRCLYDEKDAEKAEKKFNSVCKSILAGK
jgi:hypothetical protein